MPKAKSQELSHDLPKDVEIEHLHGVVYDVKADNPNTLISVLENGELPFDAQWDGPNHVRPCGDDRHFIRVLDVS